MTTATRVREVGNAERRLGDILGDEPQLLLPREEPPLPSEDQTRESFSSGKTSLAAFFASAAAGWAAAGLFSGSLPRLVGVGGAGIGAGMVWLSYRSKRTSLIQSLIVPAAIGVGALLVVPDARGGTANLPGLIAEALRGGGLAQPPVSFDPGWRFLLVVLTAVLAGAAAALACGLDRPKLAVFLPIPIVFAALAVQPGEAAGIPTIISLLLLAGAFALAFGVELAKEGATSSRFELRRLAKGASALVGLVVMLVAVTHFGFLFPQQAGSEIVPAQHPHPSPPETDRQLFLVHASISQPWRIGVLDGYDGRGWLTPPIDPSRLIIAPFARPIPSPRNRVIGMPAISPNASAPAPITVKFTITDVRGHVIPDVANTVAVDHQGLAIAYDPRTQTLQLPNQRAFAGLTYSVRTSLLPRGQDLEKAPPPPSEFASFLSVPRPPEEISNLIAQAPHSDLFSTLQYVRAKLYEKVVARGAGEPVDVRPSRVVELLAGKPGTPFEITAAEALLARWIGVPSRIGYGYFGGDHKSTGDTAISVHDAATWLEVYFQGYGWVPIVGTPPRAEQSLSNAAKNLNPAIRPAENLTLPAYVPVQLQSFRLLYTLVRYWLARIVPLGILGFGILWLYPGVFKLVRRSRRRRWAHGDLAERIRVAYTQFRDVATDFRIGHSALTPLEFLAWLDEDRQHAELAWLVSRALWGDLSRDLRIEDVEQAELMSLALTRRMKGAQTGFARVAAFASRNSLRDPFSRELPNFWWPEPSLRIRTTKILKGTLLRPLRLRHWRVATAALLTLGLLLQGCARQTTFAAGIQQLPARLVPVTLEGFRFQDEPSTERAYEQAGARSVVDQVRVFSIRSSDGVVGALHVALFKARFARREREARTELLQALGGKRFKLERVGTNMFYTQHQPELQLLLWFPSAGNYYELLTASSDFDHAPELFTSLIAYQRGEQIDQRVAPLFDPRRGFDE